MQLLQGGGQVRESRSPRFVSPTLHPAVPRLADRSALPLMVYLPGIDGSGLAASRQFCSLQCAFDLRCLFIPPEDRSGFETLLEFTCEFIRRERAHSDPARPIYLLGEGPRPLLPSAAAQGVADWLLLSPQASPSVACWPWRSV